ncbi:glycogen/starch synthase [Pseudoflavonifractor sp. MSJ-30]|uniref:glycogen/starch synthase n=1 Tax=Pseudoflavonifractor sp. MSJ-30 TaxID=2841525 RepID=UPI00209DC826|nr:glycogen/starch synthase [Pseudoflavonifractor sp. MSJ-30]
MPNTKEAAVTEPAEKPAKKRGANKAAADAPRKRASSKAASRTKETAPEVKTAEAPKRQRARKAPAPKAEDITKPETAPQLPRESAQEAPAEDISAPEVPVLEMPIETAPETAETVPEPIQEEAKSMPESYFIPQPGPRRSVVFIGSECYPFVKTGGLADVMYALPKALSRMNCDVKVILPRYACIPWEYQCKMVYRGEFQMPLCSDGRSFYVGIMEYVWDGVVYDFIDNQEFFSDGNPYTSIIGDIPKFCFFSKAALAALNYMDWIPDVIHCHDWQAALVPVYLRTLFQTTPLSRAKTMLTIHNLRFQGVYNIPTIRYWSGLPNFVFNKDALSQNWLDANMLKGGLTYCNMITTVSNTYAGEIQTPEYGETLDAHLRYHSGKLRGIVNGIDYDIWNPWTDPMLHTNYDITNVLPRKKENKRALQEELGLWQDDHKFVIGLISRLTNQKGLDLVNAILPQIMDEHTQVVVLGTGDKGYEDAFRYYENAYRGNLCANIMYDEGRAHRIYAGADALLVPSKFEPCGLTQLIGMHYGTIPIVRETGGLKDTVQPHNEFTHDGNGFTFDRYDPGLLLDAINRAKTFYFTNRYCWDEMVQRDMDKNVSWENSAWQYRNLYLELTADRG